MNRHQLFKLWMSIAFSALLSIPMWFPDYLLLVLFLQISSGLLFIWQDDKEWKEFVEGDRDFY